MGLKGPSLRLEPRPPALGLDQGGQPASLLGAGAELEPYDAHQPAPLEGPEPAWLEVEPGQPQLIQAAGDVLHDRNVDGSDETHGEMQVRGWRPPEGGRRSRAGCQIWLQPVALRVRDGQPEERADSRR